MITRPTPSEIAMLKVIASQDPKPFSPHGKEHRRICRKLYGHGFVGVIFMTSDNPQYVLQNAGRFLLATAGGAPFEP